MIFSLLNLVNKRYREHKSIRIYRKITSMNNLQDSCCFCIGMLLNAQNFYEAMHYE